MSAARLQSESDLRSISGVYDATTQPQTMSPESGKAILARRWQTSTGNVNWSKHLAVGVKRTADILLKYFPVIYDTGRVMRITGKDQQQKQIVVHSGRPETVPAFLPDGVQSVIDLSAGRYSSTVSINKNYDSQQQETVQMMLSLIEINPALAPILADLVVSEMNFPNKKAFVDRLQRALPPGLQDTNKPTDPNQLAAQNSQLMQANQKLMAQVQQLSQMIQTKALEGQSRERIEEMKLRATQISSAARLEQQRIKSQATILTRAADKMFDATHDHALATREHIHDVMLAGHQRALNPPAPAPPEQVQ
jgi:vacuolar-type H+-ATPase subunit H